MPRRKATAGATMVPLPEVSLNPFATRPVYLKPRKHLIAYRASHAPTFYTFDVNAWLIRRSRAFPTFYMLLRVS